MSGTASLRAITASGSPFTTNHRAASGASATTTERRRWWSNGRIATRVHRAVSSVAAASAASQSATSSALPLTALPASTTASLHTRPSACARAAGSPAGESDRSKVMWPSVSVPVLSVNSIVILPRSSMLTRRFTSTFLRARRREPVERLTVTIAGRSCGVRPIAIASENKSASMNGRCRITLIAKIDTVSTPATRTRRNENFRNPTWNAVSPGRSPRPTAIRPNAVCIPVRTTTPRALPERTTVPISAHDCPLLPGSVTLSTGIDSPVKTASSHSSSVTVSKRRSAGTMSPTDICTTSPGTSATTSTRCATPSRTTNAVWRICACSAATACSERNSFTKPRPTDKLTITPMITASVGLPVNPDTVAAASRSNSNGLRSWRANTVNGRTAWLRNALGP